MLQSLYPKFGPRMKIFRAQPISVPPDNCPDDVDDVDIFKLDPRYSLNAVHIARAGPHAERDTRAPSVKRSFYPVGRFVN